jgi:hypothetical protein
MVIPAAELTNAGLSAGYINSLAFDVVSTDVNTVYDYLDCSMKLVAYNQVTSRFEPVDTNINLHTNFKIATAGERVYLYDTSQTLVHSLFVNVAQPDNSIGLFPDGAVMMTLFMNGTPRATNNFSQPYSTYLLPPVISVPSGFFNSPISVTMTNPNGPGSSIRYTTNGDDPTITSQLYTGGAIPVFFSSVLKAKAFSATAIPSPPPWRPISLASVT